MTASTEFDISPIIKRWKNKRGTLIMALHDVQGRFGYVPREAIVSLSKHRFDTIARIHEVLTFYNYFKLEAPGKNIISVCTGTACHLKGAYDIFHAFSAKLGIQDGESTKDRMFHLQTVRCLGCCGLAPAVTINGKVFSKVKVSEVDNIINKTLDATT